MKKSKVKKQNSINFLIVCKFLLFHTNTEAEKKPHKIPILFITNLIVHSSFHLYN